MKRQPKIGDRVTCKIAVRAYFPSGVAFTPGMVGEVKGVAPKVHIVKGPEYDGKPDYLYVDFTGPDGETLRTSLNYCNAVVV